jgi:hypothetical protein
MKKAEEKIKSKQERLEDALLGLIEEKAETGDLHEEVPRLAHELIELWKIN